MSKFNVRDNRRVTGHGPIVTDTVPSGRTGEGAPGYARSDAKSELFLLAVTNMVSENTFYENASSRDARFETLVHTVAVEDLEWTGRFLTWLRSTGNMRTASLVGAAEAIQARKALPPVSAGFTARKLVDAVLQRADEPGELLAYWTSRHGRALPKPLKRGIGDAVRRLYTERNLFKWDSDAAAFRFGDVLDLTHPAPSSEAQALLFVYALDRRHNRDGNTTYSADMLPMLAARTQLSGLDVPQRRALLNRSDAAAVLRTAGMTWEALAGWLQGPMDTAAWEAVIPSMGYMALLRNLRNFDQAGVSDFVASHVAGKLADPVEVARSRQFPFRFLAAHRAAPSQRWGHTLDKALTLSLSNLPELPGSTLVLVDRSGSMFGGVSEKSGLNRADMAAVFGAALALRNLGRVDLVEFGTSSRPVTVGAGDSLLRIVNDRFHDLGGTYTATAARSHYRGHDRVIVVTDGQAHDGDPGAVIPAQVPMYTWNLAGYRFDSAAGGRNRHVFGGLTDAAFQLIPLLENGRNADWDALFGPVPTAGPVLSVGARTVKPSEVQK